ncbi:prepilin peptidase [Candidatus Daviesbacteria bacterium]|nr:prepilin peptidase [Candidatus Daviesbacteria bacterium]
MAMIILFTVVGFILGTVLGSLVKALADRSLSGKSFWGRSVCTKCQTTLKWYDLLPLFSFLLLKGKCRYCNKKFSINYFWVEVLMGVLIGLLFFISFPNKAVLSDTYKSIIYFFDLIFKTLVITTLFIITLTDLKKTLIPDRIILPSILIGLVALFSITIYKVVYLYYVLSQSVIGKLLLPPKNDYFFRHALITAEPLTGGIIMAVILGLFFFSLIVITRGRGMGGGDFKLGIFMGLVLGFPNSLVALLLAFLSGALVGITLLLAGRKKLGQTIPFGPFLALGSVVVIFWGDKILNWYLSLKI